MTDNTPIKAKSVSASAVSTPVPGAAPVPRPAPTAPAPPPPGRMAGDEPDHDIKPPRSPAQAKASVAPGAASSGAEPGAEPAPVPGLPARGADAASATAPAARPGPPPASAAATRDARPGAGAAIMDDSAFEAAFAELASRHHIARPARVKAFLDANRDLIEPLSRVIPKTLACDKVSRIGLSLSDHPEAEHWSLLVCARIEIADFEKRVEEYGRIDRDVFIPAVGEAHGRLGLALLHAWGRRCSPDAGTPVPAPESDSAFEAAFAALAARYHIDEAEKVEAYLARNRDLLAVLPRILVNVLAQPEVAEVGLEMFESYEEAEGYDDDSLFIRAKTTVVNIDRWIDICWEIEGDIIHHELGEYDDRLGLDFFCLDDHPA